LSQREYPGLALVTVTRNADGYRLDAPGLEALRLPIGIEAGDRVDASVWGSPVWGHEHREASEWFSAHTKASCRALYMPDTARRQVKNSEALVSFADGYPLLLVSSASLEELNRRTPEPMPMERFRPNLVLSGGPPHFEDDLVSFRLGGVRFHAPKLCDRCVVTTLDPKTGEAGREPLRTLANYRRWDGKVWFGTNLVAENQGQLELGQELGDAEIKPRRFRR